MSPKNQPKKTVGKIAVGYLSVFWILCLVLRLRICFLEFYAFHFYAVVGADGVSQHIFDVVLVTPNDAIWVR